MNPNPKGKKKKRKKKKGDLPQKNITLINFNRLESSVEHQRYLNAKKKLEFQINSLKNSDSEKSSNLFEIYKF